jgi:hypothetical protein
MTLPLLWEIARNLLLAALLGAVVGVAIGCVITAAWAWVERRRGKRLALTRKEARTMDALLRFPPQPSAALRSAMREGKPCEVKDLLEVIRRARR